MVDTGKLLREKSFAFALRIVKMSRYLNDRKQEFVLSKQVLRCGTSIGANIRESVFAQSTLDFISKLSIALKEASETQYWLELLEASKLLTSKEFTSLKSDADWLVGTLVNVIKSNKRKLKSGKAITAAQI